MTTYPGCGRGYTFIVSCGTIQIVEYAMLDGYVFIVQYVMLDVRV